MKKNINETELKSNRDRQQNYSNINKHPTIPKRLGSRSRSKDKRIISKVDKKISELDQKLYNLIQYKLNETNNKLEDQNGRLEMQESKLFNQSKELELIYLNSVQSMRRQNETIKENQNQIDKIKQELVNKQADSSSNSKSRKNIRESDFLEHMPLSLFYFIFIFNLIIPGLGTYIANQYFPNDEYKISGNLQFVSFIIPILVSCIIYGRSQLVSEFLNNLILFNLGRIWALFTSIIILLKVIKKKEGTYINK